MATPLGLKVNTIFLLLSSEILVILTQYLGAGVGVGVLVIVGVGVGVLVIVGVGVGVGVIVLVGVGVGVIVLVGVGVGVGVFVAVAAGVGVGVVVGSGVGVLVAFGLTGTLDGTLTNKLVLEGLFGKVKKVISTSETIKSGCYLS